MSIYLEAVYNQSEAVGVSLIYTLYHKWWVADFGVVTLITINIVLIIKV